MAEKVLITGANRGIGLALVKEYLARGDQVIAVCRRSSSELTQLPVQRIEGIELTDPGSINRMAAQLIGQKLNLLIANAGILRSTPLDALDFEAIEAQFQVNAVAPLRVVQALLPLLSERAKIALITSRMGSVEDNTSGGAYGYRMSKSALNALGKSLAIDLAPRGIAVALLHPGYVNTEMVNFHGEIEPEVAATNLVKRISALNIQNSGSFWHASGEPLPW